MSRLPHPTWRLGLILVFGVFRAWASGDVGVERGYESTSTWRADLSLLEEYRLRAAQNVLTAPSLLGDAPALNGTLDQRLRFLADGQVSGADEHFQGTFSGALWWALNGTPPAGTPNLFATEYDYTEPWWAIYSLSAEWRNDGALDLVRVGRQATEHGLPLTFDGASVGLQPAGPKLLLFAFGGRTVHFFETEPGLLENWVASFGATVRPNENLQIELDSRVIQEWVSNADRSEQVRVTNHSYGITTWLRTDNISSKAYVRGIDQRPSHIGGALQWESLSMGLGLDGRADAQLATLGEVVESENPYYALLGPSLPYVRFRLESWKEFQVGPISTLSFHLGYRGRQLLGVAERPFNRNTGGAYLETRVDDCGTKGLFLSGTAEWTYVPGSQELQWFLALGGAAGYTGHAIKTEVGTYYQQFKINYYQRAEELENTRTVYGLVAYRVVPWLEVRARYEFEILDRYLQSLFLSMRQDF